MKSRDATWLLVAAVFAMAMASAAMPATGRLNVSETTITQAFTAVERVDSYLDLLAQTAGPSRAQNLIGHWRNTRIIFDSPRDEHLVLMGNGVVETWSVTVSERSGTVRSGVVTGRWDTQANTLRMDWEDGKQWSGPFTFHEGELVFPNRQNQRKFWKRIK